ncbi:alpha/beta hydrolase [Motilimonas sp. KMU-193]|uniref:alpha/beta hydrolase n=1 Tax=Motilimonas sp. KMU-193 TaxID=3388668 RepID=UPI00396AF4CE
MKRPMLTKLFPIMFFGLTSTTVLAEITLESRTIPAPVGVSSPLAEIVQQREIPAAIPVPTNQAEWFTLQQTWDAPGNAQAKEIVARLGIKVTEQEIAGVKTYKLTPKEIAPEFKDRWLVHIHGGAFVFGGGESALREASWIADGLGAQVISIDYRKPPLHPFPAAIDDAVAVWQELIKTQAPEKTAMFGTSAGGNLTLATTLRLQQLNLPLPGALFAGTPAVDLKETSDSWHTLKGLDPLVQREGLINATFDLYAGGEALDNPLISPVYAKVNTFPPTLFLSGTRDLLLSDTVRMHRLLRSVNVVTDLHIYDGQSHGDYMYGLVTELPESDDAIKEIRDFFNKHLNHMCKHH